MLGHKKSEIFLKIKILETADYNVINFKIYNLVLLASGFWIFKYILVFCLMGTFHRQFLDQQSAT